MIRNYVCMTPAAVARIAAAWVFLFAWHATGAAQPDGGLELKWAAAGDDRTKSYVELGGLGEDVLKGLANDAAREEFQKILAVYARQGGLQANLFVPPMAGRYSVVDERLRFAPMFPLERGITYRAVGTDPDSGALIAETLRLEERLAAPSTVVSEVYPTSPEIPENLLKFYVHFSAPMSRGHVYQHIHLLREDGSEVEDPFLELGEELWDPELTRLTLIIDPGRIKRGVRPLEEVGPALEAGKRFKLRIEEAWLDAKGAPLKRAFVKSFEVSEPDRVTPAPVRWEILAPKAGGLSPLVVRFDGPLDHALAKRLILVKWAGGSWVEGESRLVDFERQWEFIPDQRWNAGGYELRVGALIEDLAGNNIGKPFEVDMIDDRKPEDLVDTVLPFVVD